MVCVVAQTYLLVGVGSRCFWRLDKLFNEHAANVARDDEMTNSNQRLMTTNDLTNGLPGNDNERHRQLTDQEVAGFFLKQFSRT